MGRNRPRHHLLPSALDIDAIAFQETLMRTIACTLVFVLGAALVGCGGTASSSAPVTSSSDVGGASAKPATAPVVEDFHVDGKTAKKLVAGGAQLVDVRSADEYAAAHIAGAENAPVDAIDGRDLGPKDRALVLYCGSGKRAARAASSLRARGYTRVYELGGMSDWDK